MSVGETIASAHPEKLSDDPGPERDYVRKVVLQRKVVAKGGCG